jgi:hypothetical protein
MPREDPMALRRQKELEEAQAADRATRAKKEKPKTKEERRAERQAEVEARRKKEAKVRAEAAALSEQRAAELRQAAANGNLEAVTRMVDGDGVTTPSYPIDGATDEGITPLMKAAMYGHADVGQVLIDAGADVELHDERGRTALMLASLNGEAGVIANLLAAGAQPAGAGVLASRTGASDDGRTALMLAAAGGHAESVQLLLGAGAPCYDVDGRGLTALQIAQAQGHEEVVQILSVYMALHPRPAPGAWRKVRRVRAAAHSASAFGGNGRTTTFGRLIKDGTFGASMLSWLNSAAANTAKLARQLTRKFTTSFSSRKQEASSTNSTSSLRKV